MKKILRALALAMSIVFMAASQPTRADILNVPIDYPAIESDAGQTCSFNASSQTLTLGGVPTLVYFESTESNVGFIDPPASISLSANIDSSGALTGGTFTISASVIDFDASESFISPLLTGTIVAYGIDAPGTSDVIDFRIQPTGGSLLARFMPGDQIGVRVVLEGSTWASSFASNWGCSRAKFRIGPTPPQFQETCALLITKSANPVTIGPITRKEGHDKEGDSDDDNDDNGHGYSRDDDDASISCGCRGKVSELNIRYNGWQTADVKVTRKAPYSATLYQGTVQPGGQFTVPASNYGPEGFSGTLGNSIEIAVDGGEAVEIETSGAKDIGPGRHEGNFEVMSGKSRKLHKPLCPMPGSSCPANQLVTYTYTLTNSGSTLTGLALDDNKIGNILAGGTLAAGQSATFTKTACLSQTTTNIATAMGLLPSGAHCAPLTPAQATVTLLMPPPDCNKHYHDCDPDEVPPPPPPGHGGCSGDYWKGHKNNWGKSFKHGDKFSAIFQVDSAGNRSLSDTLDIDGGGSKELGREAVAALLNASNPDVNFAYTPAQVKSMVQDAYRTKDYATCTKKLKQENKNSCPRHD